MEDRMTGLFPLKAPAIGQDSMIGDNTTTLTDGNDRSSWKNDPNVSIPGSASQLFEVFRTSFERQNEHNRQYDGIHDLSHQLQLIDTFVSKPFSLSISTVEMLQLDNPMVDIVNQLQNATIAEMFDWIVKMEDVDSICDIPHFERIRTDLAMLFCFGQFLQEASKCTGLQEDWEDKFECFFRYHLSSYQQEIDQEYSNAVEYGINCLIEEMTGSGHVKIGRSQRMLVTKSCLKAMKPITAAKLIMMLTFDE